MPATARVGERAVFCDVSNGDAVEDANGRRTVLLAEADPGGARCAAFWPREAGWHALVRGNGRSPFFVRDIGSAAALANADDARATRALLGTAAQEAPQETRETPMPRWPFFLAFLAMASLLWLMERTRR